MPQWKQSIYVRSNFDKGTNGKIPCVVTEKKDFDGNNLQSNI